MRYRLSHPDPNHLDLWVVYGWDHSVGFFAELRSGEDGEEPLAEYCALEPGYNHTRPLRGLLDWLVMVGALTGSELDAGLLVVRGIGDVDHSREGRRAVEVIENLRRDAD